jgi:hypothetical protein
MSRKRCLQPQGNYDFEVIFSDHSQEQDENNEIDHHSESEQHLEAEKDEEDED